MRIILCLDYSPFTEKVLGTMQSLVKSFNDCKIAVVHVIDESLYSTITGFEAELNPYPSEDSAQLKQLCTQYLGENVDYVEEYGIPRQKLDEVLANSDYDLLAIGSHSKNMLGERRLGGTAEHLLFSGKVPVIIIP